MQAESEPWPAVELKKHTDPSEDTTSAVIELEVDVKSSEETSNRPTGLRWFLLVSAIIMGMFLFALDSTIVADVQPKIVDEFRAVELLPWLALAFMTPSVGLMLPNGQLFQTFNAKWLYISGVIIFEAASALCGAAPNITVFIIARAVSGTARAFIYTGTLFLLSVNTNEAERPMYMGFIGTTWGLGTALGPIVGGALAGSLGWRWAFYLNLPIGLFMVPVAILLLPNCDMMKGCPVRERLRQVDWIGGFLLICFTGLFLTTFAFAGNEYAWNSGPVIGMFSATGVLFLLFVLSQTRWMPGQTPEKRVFPVELLFMRLPVLLFILCMSATTLIYITLFYIPLFLEFTRNLTPIHAGVVFLPIITALLTASIGGGILLTKVRYYFPFYLAGSIIGLTGSVLLYFSQVDTSLVQTCASAALVGAGSALYAQVGFSVIPSKIPTHRIGHAIGFLSTAQVFGGSVCVAIGETIVVSVAASKLAVILPGTPTVVLKNMVGGTSNSLFNSLTADIKGAVIRAIVDAIDKAYILGIVAGLVGIICTLFLPHERIAAKNGPKVELEGMEDDKSVGSVSM